MKFGKAIMNTCKASTIELWCARLFGDRHQECDEFGMTVTTGEWRGKTYFVDYEESTKERQG